MIIYVKFPNGDKKITWWLIYHDRKLKTNHQFWTNPSTWLGFAVRCLEKVKNILRNGDLMVIYHGTIRKKITSNKSKMSGEIWYFHPNLRLEPKVFPQTVAMIKRNPSRCWGCGTSPDQWLFEETSTKKQDPKSSLFSKQNDCQWWGWKNTPLKFNESAPEKWWLADENLSCWGSVAFQGLCSWLFNQPPLTYPPPEIRVEIRPYEGKPMVNKPLISPYFCWGYVRGGGLVDQP